MLYFEERRAELFFFFIKSVFSTVFEPWFSVGLRANAKTETSLEDEGSTKANSSSDSKNKIQEENKWKVRDIGRILA